ncbi:MAG TPA: hypothetical protein PLV67_08130 [Methanofastidiosum sp.]|nr:hypothetical protein [Methanofastidiosum sp.]
MFNKIYQEETNIYGQLDTVYNFYYDLTMVDAYDFVFTFHNDELENFENLLKETFYGK